MRRRFVAGNWKMHGSLAANRELTDALKSPLRECDTVDVVVCPPFPFLSEVAKQIGGTRIALGAQNLSPFASGAYTGEVSGPMLADVGCSYVIVGHSERRALYGESDSLVGEKCAAALQAGLTPVVCVGETLAERERDETNAVVQRQLRAVTDRIGADAMARMIVAYEPVWAIGTGKTATPEQAQAVHAFLRSVIRGLSARYAEGVRIVYGGSVKAANARDLFRSPDIDGGLIGGASLIAADFAAICSAAAGN